MGCGIGADVNVSGVPAIAGGDVIRARRRDADEIGQCTDHHIVAGPRPCFIGDNHIGVVHTRVVEKVQRFPAAPLGDAIGVEGEIEILGTIDVAGITGVVVKARIASGGEGIVASARVLDHFHHRFKIETESLGGKARRGIGAAGQRPRHRGIERVLQPLVELPRRETLEVRHLAARHVDDLDVFAGLHLEGARRGGSNTDVLQRVGQWFRQIADTRRSARCYALNQQFDIGRRVLRLRRHVDSRCRNNQHATLAGHKHGVGFRQACQAEETDAARRRQIDIAAAQGGQRSSRTFTGVLQQGLEARRLSVCRRAEATKVEMAPGVTEQNFAGLTTLDVGQRDPVTGRNLGHNRATALHRIAFGIGGQAALARPQDAACGRCRVALRERQHVVSINGHQVADKADKPPFQNGISAEYVIVSLDRRYNTIKKYFLGLEGGTSAPESHS